MQTSEKGLGIIKPFEGRHLEVYKCPAGIATIGYGSTYYEDGSKVKMTDPPISEDRAEQLLLNTLKGFEVGVMKRTTAHINQEMFDALVSFCFNLGLGNYQASTLRMKLNRGEYEDIYEQFLRWNKAGGMVLRGLTRRRKAEGVLFNEGVVSLDKGEGFFDSILSFFRKKIDN